MENNISTGKYPIKLCENRVWRTYKGGKLLNQWKGMSDLSDSQFPEEWIASLISSRIPGREQIKNEGLSEIEVEPGRRTFLKTLIESNPELFLGKKHVEKYGKNSGVLVKALDSQERLTIQVHPDKDSARKIFGSEYGKTEAWYIINNREVNGERPYILLGFKPGITREQWERMFWIQDIEGMIDSLHKFYVKPGQVFLIEGGIPHAIGPGCFLIEIQEPTDYTIRVERKTPSGLNITDFLCHQGVGFDKMFECFKYTGFSFEEVNKRWCKVNKEEVLITETERVLISYKDTPYFSLSSIKIENKYEFCDINTFSIIVIIDGNGSLIWDNGEMDIKKGDEIFLPVGVKNVILKTKEEEPLLIVRCFPPI